MFTAHNRHSESCGTPPNWGTDDEHYYAYFENFYHEQFIYVRDLKTGKALLYGGDMGWDRAYPVTDGKVENLYLNALEYGWLMVVDKVSENIYKAIEENRNNAEIPE